MGKRERGRRSTNSVRDHSLFDGRAKTCRCPKGGTESKRGEEKIDCQDKESRVTGFKSREGCEPDRSCLDGLRLHVIGAPHVPLRLIDVVVIANFAIMINARESPSGQRTKNESGNGDEDGSCGRQVSRGDQKARAESKRRGL